MHRGRILQAGQHHWNEVVDALHRWGGHRVGAAGGDRHVQQDHHIGGEYTAPGLGVLGVKETAVARLQLPNRFDLVSHPVTPPRPEAYTVTYLVSPRRVQEGPA